jgi:hypothetical protein
MYQHDSEARPEKRRPDGPGRVTPEVRARHALGRVEQLFSDASSKLTLDRDRIRAALQAPLTDPDLEQQRLFALGWLGWLDGDLAAAKASLSRCTGARAAYWLGRVRLLNNEMEGLSAYEQQMRTFQGSPQATCWFVDLLWRSGKHDRAAQVWKSVRLNKRVTACEESVLLEARSLLGQDDAAAEKALREATPHSTVLQTERLLLLAWLMATRQKRDDALDLLDEVHSELFPIRVLGAWRALIQRDGNFTFADLDRLHLSSPARAWVKAQQERLPGGDPGRSLALLEGMTGVPRLQGLVRYVRACLGNEDFAALLASLPGPFLATRCRVWATLARFCRGECPPAELLGTLQQSSGLESWQELARALAEGVSAEELWRKGDHNLRRAAVDAGLKRWTPAELAKILPGWGRELIDSDDAPLKRRVGRQLLRLRLQSEKTSDELLSTAERLLGSTELSGLVRDVLAPAGTELSPGVRAFLANESAAPVALCLNAFESAARGDLATLLPLLEPSPLWQRLATPPAFLCRALAGVGSSERGRETLARWLHQWPASPELEALAMRAGLTPPRPDSAEPPPGVDAVAWMLHQASASIARNDPIAALAWVRRASNSGLQALDEARRNAVEKALPELERLARAALLALVARFDPQHPLTPASLLIGFSDLLQQSPGGPEVFAAAENGNFAQARGRLATVAEHPELSPQLAHHLALVYTRAARQLEQQDRDDLAAPCWRRAWRCWQVWANSAELSAVRLLIDHLLTGHRTRLKDLLARNLVNRARPLWDLLQAIQPADTEAGKLVREHLAGFRDQLATDFLLEMRDAMRHGAIPQGWRSDYEQGLARLRRLLSLDRDNRRLLTALVEICADWFLDLYDLRDAKRLKDEVERYTPFSQQLARTLGKTGDTWPEEMTARTALSEFFKFRAFVTDDMERKRELYREALAFNPANENVRNLLGGMEDNT